MERAATELTKRFLNVVAELVKTGLKQKEVSQSIGRSASYITEIIHGRANVSKDSIRRLVEVYNVNIAYMHKGALPMFNVAPQAFPPSTTLFSDPMNENSLIETYKDLSAYRCYLMDDAVNIIKEYMSKPDRYIFPRITTQTYNKHLKIIAEVVGIRNLSSHVGRHTFASWVLRKGVPITTIQRMMGHTQLRTTMIYAELDDATIKSDMIRAFG